MARPIRRHARKASATTAEEILLPSELMAGLTCTLTSTPVSTHQNCTDTADTLSSIAENDGIATAPSSETTAPPDISELSLAPLFPALTVTTPDTIDNSQETNDQSLESDDNLGLSTSPAHQITSHFRPDRGILKNSAREPTTTGSRWSLWPGAKKWISETLSTNNSQQHPTFAQGAGIPAAPCSTRPSMDISSGAVSPVILSRTAPSIDFERSTNMVPPLSQERIKSTEFWSNFALELDPSKLKRIRFSMPLIVTEFDPETSRVYDPDMELVTSVETNNSALRDAEDTNSSTNESDTEAAAIQRGDKYPSLDARQLSINHPEDEEGTETNNNGRASSDSRESRPSSDQQTDPWSELPSSDIVGEHPIQWDVEALSNRQYRVQEVWEIYERTCRSLDTQPLAALEGILKRHMEKEQTLGSLSLSGTQLHGAHMRCFSELLDLNFGLVKLDLSYCDIDDDAARLLVYSMLCNDSVRQLNLSNNSRIHSDGIRFISILIRHSKQLELLDISGIPIRKKSAGYLAAALTGLGANWTVGSGSMRRRDSMCEQVSLRGLHMNCCGIKPAALAILASGIRLSPLQHLSLRLNGLSGSSGPIFREMLYGDPPQPAQHQKPLLAPQRPISMSLHGLSDAQNYKKPYDTNTIPTVALGQEYHVEQQPRVSRLQSLDLSQNDLSHAVLDLAEGLLWNTNLRSLILRQSKLQAATFSPFMECLGINQGLVYLDISRNPVCGPSIAAVETLAHVIAQNRSLRGLFMSATGMTSEGAISLAECLPELQCLERLDVSENPGIDVAGLMALSASIKLNKSLICVEITVNTGDEDCAALEQGIAQTCIANMQRLDSSSPAVTAGAAAATITMSHQHISNGLDFGHAGLVSAHVWPHADMAPESELPGVVATKVSGEDDRSEYTSLVTDIAVVKRSSSASSGTAPAGVE